MKHHSFQIILFLALTAFFSCSDPALIGSELLSEDVIGLEFSDQLPITGRTIEGGVIQTYSPFGIEALPNHLLGRIDDPLFGVSEASIYTQFALGFGSQATPNLAGAQVDSVVMSVAYVTTNRGYGDLNQVFEVEVLPIGQDMQTIDNYFSDNTLETIPPKEEGERIIARFIPAQAEELIVDNYTEPDTVKKDTLLPHLRIRMDRLFTNLDTTAFVSNSSLHEKIRGLHIRPTGNEVGMLNLNFLSPSSRVSVYYSISKGDITGEPMEYQFDFNLDNSRFINYSNTIGTTVKTAIENNSDSLLYMQGMVGSNIELSFPDLSAFENIVVNKAELELTVVPTNDSTALPVQLSVSGSTNGELTLITDQQSAIGVRDSLGLENFGGKPIIEMVDGLSMNKYKINLSGYLQKIVDGDVDNKLIISAGAEQASIFIGNAANSVFPPFVPKAGNASKAIFYGPNHSQFPLKINLTYTKL